MHGTLGTPTIDLGQHPHYTKINCCATSVNLDQKGDAKHEGLLYSKS